MDKITITGLHVQGRHGVLAAEQEEPQEYIIDVTLCLDLSDATRSDDLTSSPPSSGL
ncbi:MAG: dihydroneopterin aldolase, partial [Parascardovia denticolens]